MIKTNDEQFPVNMMCRMLSVSRSGYYAWKHRPQSNRSQANKLLTDDIKRIFDNEKERSGSPRITKLLQQEGKIVGRHRTY
jgi:hypothetical protein